jgi:DNA-binding CsgD family transcriptional regulator/PAS domain-containing protein
MKADFRVGGRARPAGRLAPGSGGGSRPTRGRPLVSDHMETDVRSHARDDSDYRVGPEIPVEDRLRLLESAEQAAQLGSWEWFPGPDVQRWSDNLYRIFGLEARVVAPSWEIVLERTHPDDRARVARYVQMTRLTAEPVAIEYRIEVPGRGLRYVRSTITSVEPGTPEAKRIIGTVQDVSERRRADREIEAHLAVGDVLLEWETLEQGAELLVHRVAQAMDFDAGVFWLPRETMLVPAVFWSSGRLDGAVLRSTTGPLRLPSDEHLPAWVWENLEPAVWRAGVETRLRPEAAVRMGLRSSIAFPAIRSKEVLAVVELLSREELEPTRRLTRSLTGIGHELGRFLDGRRGELGPKLLTPRELEVLQLAADGYSGRKIATQLGLSLATVKTHFEHIYTKLKVYDRTSAVAIALRRGFIG